MPRTLIRQQTQIRGGAGAGLTEAAHEVLDTLVHDVAETCFLEVTRTAGRTTAITYWDSPAKLRKVRQALITRVAGRVSQVAETQYDAAGVAYHTLTTNFARNPQQRVASADLAAT